MADPQILVSHTLDPELRAILLKALPAGFRIEFLADVGSGEREDAISRAEVVMSWNPVKEFDSKEFGLFKNIQLFQLLTAGADHLPFRSLPEHVLIASNAGAFAVPMAEHTLGMVLALAKRLCVNNIKLARGEFDQETKNRLIRGLTLGVLGYGGIGRAAAQLMSNFELKILAVNRSGRTKDRVEFAGTLDDLEYVVKNSDILLIAIPLTKATRGILGTRELSLMKPDAILINVARGAIIDQGALYRHLVENPGFMAGMDTWWIEPAMDGEFKVNYPFFDLPNFLGSPHNSAIVPGIMREVVRMAAENVARFLSGEKIAGEVRREDYIDAE